MPQFDWKGSPRGAVTGVERGSEVERVVIVHHTAVLACVCAEQRVLCSLVCRLWVCQGAVRARPRGQQRTWTGTAGTTNPPVYSTHRRCSTGRTLAASISPTTHTSRSLKRTAKLGLVHVGRLVSRHARQTEIKLGALSASETLSGQDSSDSCEINEKDRMGRSPGCTQAYVGPAEAHCPHVPTNPHICSATERVGRLQGG